MANGHDRHFNSMVSLFHGLTCEISALHCRLLWLQPTLIQFCPGWQYKTKTTLMGDETDLIQHNALFESGTSQVIHVVEIV